jgi:hypothetical protein
MKSFTFIDFWVLIFHCVFLSINQNCIYKVLVCVLLTISFVDFLYCGNVF